MMSSLLSQISLCLSPWSILIIGLKAHVTNPGGCHHLQLITFAKALRIRVWAVCTATFQCTVPLLNSEIFQGILNHLPDDLTGLKKINGWVLWVCGQNLKIGFEDYMDLIYPSVLLSSELLCNTWARISGHKISHFAVATVAVAEEIYMD